MLDLTNRRKGNIDLGHTIPLAPSEGSPSKSIGSRIAFDGVSESASKFNRVDWSQRAYRGVLGMNCAQIWYIEGTKP